MDFRKGYTKNWIKLIEFRRAFNEESGFSNSKFHFKITQKNSKADL